MRPEALRIAALIAAACGACAHAPAQRAPAPEVVWPAPPAAPRVRLAGVFPDPDAPPPRRPVWRAILDAVAGVERFERDSGGGLARPFGVAVLADGSFVVADPDKPAVLQVRARGAASPLRCKGREWLAPMAVAQGPDGSLYVADGEAAEVVRIAPGGACTALGTGALQRPTGIAVARDRLFVADPPRHEVAVLSLDGALVARFGSLGEGDGQLHFPTALALAPDGDLLVVDALNFRIARFSPDGEWRGAFGTPGEVDGQLARPKGIAVDDAARIYVSDAQRDLVLVYAADGTFECALGAGGADPGRLTMPAGVAVGNGKLLVADSHNQRVQVFGLLGDVP